MLGLDTNVLVRLLVQDDPRQYARARRLLRRELASGVPVLVSHLVLLEAEWVLRSRYGYTKAAIMDVFVGLLGATDIQIEGEVCVERALFLWDRFGAEFADCLAGEHHLALGCEATATFDARAQKLPGFVAA